MIDVHSHVIPGVDDGARTIEESVEMFKEASNVGFTDIILTPHFILNYYENLPEEIDLWKEGLKKVVDKNKLNINLYSGMEIYSNNEFDSLFKEKRVFGLAESNYLLLELPMNTNIKYFDDMIFYLISIGFIPILAHPERYKNLQKDPELILEYIEKGCLIQCNYGSIAGLYGTAAKNLIKKFLKEDLIDFLGSDCHNKKTIYPMIPKILKKIEKIVGKEKTYALTTINPKKIIE